MVSMGCPIVPSPNSQFGSLYLISLKYNHQCKSGLDPIDCKFSFSKKSWLLLAEKLAKILVTIMMLCEEGEGLVRSRAGGMGSL